MIVSCTMLAAAFAVAERFGEEAQVKAPMKDGSEDKQTLSCPKPSISHWLAVPTEVLPMDLRLATASRLSFKIKLVQAIDGTLNSWRLK